MEGPGNNQPVKRAGDSNNPHGAPEIRDWQKNTWTGPMPMNVSPFEEPDNAPELLQQRSENLSDRNGAFWMLCMERWKPLCPSTAIPPRCVPRCE